MMKNFVQAHPAVCSGGEWASFCCWYFLGLGLLCLGWQETTHLRRGLGSPKRNCGCCDGNSGRGLPLAQHTPEEWMDGYAWAMVLDDTKYPVELRFAGRAELRLYHRRSGGLPALVSGRLSSVLLGGGLWPVRHRGLPEEFVEIQHLHLAGVHP